MTGSIALAALLAFSPAQAGGLTISNARLTYRDYGATRPDARYLPRDIVFLTFDMDGLKMNDEGEVGYSMGMDVLDKVSKAIKSYSPAKYTQLLPLGGTKLPGFIF